MSQGCIERQRASDRGSYSQEWREQHCTWDAEGERSTFIWSDRTKRFGIPAKKLECETSATDSGTTMRGTTTFSGSVPEATPISAPPGFTWFRVWRLKFGI